MHTMIHLQRALDDAGMTQAQLSRSTGFSTSHISDFVKGRRVPTVESLVKLAKALGCTTDSLLAPEAAP